MIHRHHVHATLKRTWTVSCNHELNELETTWKDDDDNEAEYDAECNDDDNDDDDDDDDDDDHGDNKLTNPQPNKPTNQNR